jgi:3'(2'), 5'-bisphosphate nucleotidase
MRFAFAGTGTAGAAGGMNANPFLDVARPLALKAAAALMTLRQSPLSKRQKADHSVVTNGDLEADRIIREGLRRAFPDHAILTEESGLEGDATQEFVWVVDPLDGTRAYVKGTRGFSVMIGLMRAGKPYAGVVADPWDGQLFSAVRGAGTFFSQGGSLEAELVHVSKRNVWSEMPLISSTGFPPKAKAAIEKALPCRWLPALNSVGIKVGVLVRQLADLYLNHHDVHYWDTCAPQVILEEAGGRISYLDGNPLRYEMRGEYRHAMPTLATNAQRHDEALAIVAPLTERA